MKFVLLALLTALALAVSGCPTGTSGTSAPSDHTASRGGVLHAPGFADPQANCSACHGITADTGSSVACTNCHSASQFQ